MPVNGTKTSYLINTTNAIAVLNNTESLLTDLVSITWDSSISMFIFEGNHKRTGLNGFIIKTPRVLATKAEIASFLSSLSGQVVVANNISSLRLYQTDPSFIEVVLV